MRFETKTAEPSCEEDGELREDNPSNGEWWGDFLDVDEIAQTPAMFMVSLLPLLTPSHSFVGPAGSSAVESCPPTALSVF